MEGCGAAVGITNGQVNEVVVTVDVDGGNHAGTLVFASCGVACFDLVTRFVSPMGLVVPSFIGIWVSGLKLQASAAFRLARR